MNLFDLTGKKAIVTGAARGLSRGMAEGLHDAGAEVVILDILDEGAETAKEMSKTGAPVHFIKADLLDREQVVEKFNEALGILGTLDIIINGAGFHISGDAADYKLEDWDKVIQIHLTTTFMLSQLAARVMLEKGYGKIINIASMLSFFGGYRVAAYATAKGAVAQLTKNFSNDWAGRGINCNCIAPGYMDTKINAHISKDAAPERFEEITQRIPAGRWGTPDDVKGIAVFLASHASDYVCGTVIPVDGGYLVR